MLTTAVLGLGEAGQIYAAGLSHGGCQVTAYDPYQRADIPGVLQRETLAEAVEDADIVISLVGAKAAAEVSSQSWPLLGPKAIFADFNTGSPEFKRQLATTTSSSAQQFLDVAVMAPVPRNGVATPLLASGPQAAQFAGLLAPFGAPVRVLSDRVGEAAERKLLRSIFMKGLAGLALECAAAGEAAGCKTWLLDEMATELGPNGPALINRLIEGSEAHAQRRVGEMADVVAHLGELGTPSWMSRATEAWLEHLTSPTPPTPVRATPPGSDRISEHKA